MCRFYSFFEQSNIRFYSFLLKNSVRFYSFLIKNFNILQSKKAVLENAIKGNAKGGIYENIIAETLVKKDMHFITISLNLKKEFTGHINAPIFVCHFVEAEVQS